MTPRSGFDGRGAGVGLLSGGAGFGAAFGSGTDLLSGGTAGFGAAFGSGTGGLPTGGGGAP